MLNFAVGPVQSNETVKEIGARDVPYFRTSEFSSIMLENEKMMLALTNAPAGSKTVFITGSGTASMEATIMNTLSPEDKAIVINGGSFGQRFVDLLRIHDIPYSEIIPPFGESITAEMLSQFDGKDYSAFIVNVHETSTGVHYDIQLIAEFCRRNNLLLIVDAISSFLADEFDMNALGADVMITGSQKALACPPGVSIIVLSPKALDRVNRSNPKCMYFDLKDALRNQIRGQTPFTPAVGILMQINARLCEICDNGGVESEIHRIAGLASYFREKIRSLPFETVSNSMSNAVTSLHPTTASASELFTILKDEYGIWICPNGGDLKDTVFRIGHIGYLQEEDYDKLIDAFFDLQRRGII